MTNSTNDSVPCRTFSGSSSNDLYVGKSSTLTWTSEWAKTQMSAWLVARLAAFAADIGRVRSQSNLGNDFCRFTAMRALTQWEITHRNFSLYSLTVRRMSSARSPMYWSNDCASADGIVISVTVSSRALRTDGHPSTAKTARVKDVRVMSL